MTKASKAKKGLPPSVARALRKLGADVSVARRRRGIPMELMAERAFVDRKSLRRIERGDPGVSVGIYASVLFVLGLIDRLAALADPAHDTLGQDLAEESLPKRVHLPRAPKDDADAA
jgi:hypothetical protein